jgi:hypothetical protein
MPCFAQHDSSAVCVPAALVTFEQDNLVGVASEEGTVARIHTHVILMQSMAVDSMIDSRPDQTAARMRDMGDGMPNNPNVHSLGDNAVYWSDMNVTSVEQVVLGTALLSQGV